MVLKLVLISLIRLRINGLISMSEIQISNPKAGELSKEEINYTADLINRVYLITESDFWPQNGDYERVNTQELTQFIEKDELIIAKLGDEIVGAVHVYKNTETVGGFGMLVSDPEKRGLKIGSKLVNAVEVWCKKRSCTQIQLELLKPDDKIHPDKEFLYKWYTRIGYEFQSKTPYGDMYPELASLLKIPCTFEVYLKNL